MPQRIELERMAPEAISEALTASGLSLWEFCGLFDLNYDNAKRWLLPEEHKRAQEPPYWITPVLAMLVNLHTRHGVLAIAQRCRAEAGAQEPERAA